MKTSLLSTLILNFDDPQTKNFLRKCRHDACTCQLSRTRHLHKQDWALLVLLITIWTLNHCYYAIILAIQNDMTVIKECVYISDDFIMYIDTYMMTKNICNYLFCKRDWSKIVFDTNQWNVMVINYIIFTSFTITSYLLNKSVSSISNYLSL